MNFMPSIIGITLTVLACLGATGMWGRGPQLIAIVALGLACIIADLKASNHG